MRRTILGCLALVLIILCVAISLVLFKFDTLFVNYGDSPTKRQTLNGPVEGVEQTTALGQKFYSFYGIPFAEPPITGIDPYTGEHVDRRFKVG